MLTLGVVLLLIAGTAAAVARGVPRWVPFLGPMAIAALFVIWDSAKPAPAGAEESSGTVAIAVPTVGVAVCLVGAGFLLRHR